MLQRIRVFFTLLVVALIAEAVTAHEGEEHGTPSQAVSAAASGQTYTAQSDNFDLVVKCRTIEPAKDSPLDIYLSDYETNAPIAGATMNISVVGSDSLTWEALAESQPGRYAVTVRLPALGLHDLLFDISTNDKSDLLELKGIRVGMEETVPPKPQRRITPWLIAAIGAATLAALLFALLRLRGKTEQRTVVLGLVILSAGIIPRAAYGHGGEDHGDQGGSGSSTAGIPGYMSKGSQFLLGVRTVMAQTRPVSKQIRALGRVVAPPKSQVQVYAPQSGLLVASDERSYPDVGVWVRRGSRSRRCRFWICS